MSAGVIKAMLRLAPLLLILLQLSAGIIMQERDCAKEASISDLRNMIKGKLRILETKTTELSKNLKKVAKAVVPKEPKAAAMTVPIAIMAHILAFSACGLGYYTLPSGLFRQLDGCLKERSKALVAFFVAVLLSARLMASIRHWLCDMGGYFQSIPMVSISLLSSNMLYQWNLTYVPVLDALASNASDSMSPENDPQLDLLVLRLISDAIAFLRSLSPIYSVMMGWMIGSLMLYCSFQIIRLVAKVESHSGELTPLELTGCYYFAYFLAICVYAWLFLSLPQKLSLLPSFVQTWRI